MELKDRIRNALVEDPGVSAQVLAGRFGCSWQKVSALKRYLRVGPTQTPKVKQHEAFLSMMIQLPHTGDHIEVKLRNGGGELVGTIELSSDGISYKRPNQKLQSDRKLTWVVLDKLMQVGLV